MKTRVTVLSIVLALSSLVVSKPAPAIVKYYGTEHLNAAQVYNITRTIDLQFLAAYGCIGQSCLIADASGSTGRDPTARPEGGSDDDMACISHYNPRLGSVIQSFGGNLPQGPKQDLGLSSALMGALNSIWRPFTMASGSTDKGHYKAQCDRNILIYAKGTMEPGNYGITVGPQLTSGLPSDWTTDYVSYDADVPGDYCLGLPGGMVAKDMINEAASKCPNSNIFLAGYSQGAMVVHNGLAYSEGYSQSRVKGVITFGDPFQGAPIRGWQGPIVTFCKESDGVCSGNFEVAAAHLSYFADDSIQKAKEALLNMASGRQFQG